MTSPTDPAPTIEELIERSSLGTPGAKALRERVPDKVAGRIVARSKEIQAERDGFTDADVELVAEALNRSRARNVGVQRRDQVSNRLRREARHVLGTLARAGRLAREINDVGS